MQCRWMFRAQMLQLICNQVWYMLVKRIQAVQQVKSYCKELKPFQKPPVRQMQLLTAVEKQRREKRKVFGIRCHHGKVCTQKQSGALV